ncbi:hypothetical protein MATR_34790 [Marivirga tractuosa]|uniref:Lipoprotein n=1 Tax=Marivirga tractuosa (strain ATCC 23168 / DSM 4126 / NBRC 15989 / NCIMB 1408 / VKM B-1430 / H-43) TaxID=643867 RepID=E4TQF2_MARTH|nr:hypothetical protein [Marivirga tractuosa]ADR22675.1 hypothetical protein Ftrac_2697 [Marivirga tractuosa DSM 4126]BDD16654.1 hypothetical protein MATR_34790 [Marivirga tractuosa]
MMKKLSFITYLSIVLLFTMSACNNNTNEKNVAEKSQFQHDKNELGIELNNGQKWEVNQEMKPPLERSEISLNKYDGKNYEILAEQLKANNDELVKTCTMKGKSHDELHKWLHPHMKLTTSLLEAKNEKEADKIIQKLKNSFDTFHQYFQ